MNTTQYLTHSIVDHLAGLNETIQHFQKIVNTLSTEYEAILDDICDDNDTSRYCSNSDAHLLTLCRTLYETDDYLIAAYQFLAFELHLFECR
jgi:Mg2+ and Co2+ transporter CorA